MEIRSGPALAPEHGVVSKRTQGVGDEGGNVGDEEFSDLDGLVGWRFNGVAARTGRKLNGGGSSGRKSWQGFAESDLLDPR